MFISRPKPKPSNISDPKLRKTVEKLAAMYLRGNWRIDPHRTNNVNKEFKKRTEAAKKIQRFVRKMRVINRAKACAPHTRTINNPNWKAFFEYQMRRIKPQKIKTHSAPPLPKINRRFGLWFNYGNHWMSPNGHVMYFPKTNTMRINGVNYTNAFKKFVLPRPSS